MASSSTSSIRKIFKYDVFLSFRGEDTRTSFVDHLYHALKQKSIHTYKDDEEIKKGENITDELIGSIEDSKFYIIVFSKGYASSSWCLNELVKIMECQKTNEHTAYPVFYDVEPQEVRKQEGAVADAFDILKNKEAAGIWRKALKEAADLAGWELKNTDDGHEAKFIRKIVEVVSLELRSISFNIDEKLVGMETRIKDLVPSLGIGCDDVRMIGIKGMGGGGKTTLARAVFDHISFHFEGTSFVENVREKDSLSGLTQLQNQVLSDVLNDKDIKVSGVYEGKHMMKRRMPNRKGLVVLDDVDHINQLEALAGDPNWFKAGSVIIITTRDEQVLVAHRVKFIHDVNLLSYEEAICLFSRFAFGRDIPIQGYEELSRQVVHYAAGLPLTIKVLGSFLCGKDELEWIDALERLKTIPETQTLKKLEISYISLEEDYKEMFLDVACFMKDWGKDAAIKVLECCGFHARNGLRVLQQKSLITMYYDILDMHDHIEEMGRNIVRRGHPDEPHNHSRLWVEDEIGEILANDLGTKATRCIQFHSMKFNPHIFIKGLRKMKELRFLSVDGYSSSDLEFSMAGSDFPNAIRYMDWSNYPFSSLPTMFQANNLVALKMFRSRIVQLWEGGESKVFNKLRFLDLSYSRLSTIDLGLTPNLETLTLHSCRDLLELHMTAGCLKLTSVDIQGSRLSALDLRLAPNLEKLLLSECNNLEKLHLPGRCLNLIELTLTDSKLRTFDLGMTPNIEKLTLQESCCLKELHMANECQKLTKLNISHSKLRTFDLGMTPNIEKLTLQESCCLKELHMANECQKLTKLNISHSKLRTFDLGMTPNIEKLTLQESCCLKELHMANECQKLTKLNLSHSKLRTFDLGMTPNIEKLTLQESCCLKELHMANECQKLTKLNISHSKLRTFDLGMTPNLDTLNLQESRCLEELHMANECQKLTKLNISHSKLRTFDLGMTPNLDTLNLQESRCLEELHMANECQKLTKLNISHSKLRTFDLGMTPNLDTLNLQESRCLEELHMANECQKLTKLNISHSKLRTFDLGMTPNLKKLSLKECHKLVELRTPIGCLNKLVHLDLSGCLGFSSFLFYIVDYTSCSVDESLEVGPSAKLELIVETLERCPLHPDNNLPKFQFECLYKEDRTSFPTNLEMFLSVGMCACTNLETFSQNICGLRRLRKLELKGSFLETVKDLDQLESLEELILSSTTIKHLPDSICMLKHLKYLELIDCLLLERLPEDLGRLECLEKLTLQSTTIKHLPDSICMLKHLRYLRLGFCWLLEKLPEGIGELESLRILTLSSAKIKHLPDSICMLKHLQYLRLEFCWLLEKLPEGIGELESLRMLTLSSAKIKHLPDSICMLKRLTFLQLDHCLLLEKLPEELGRLEHLRYLEVRGTSIIHLPQSILLVKGLRIFGSRELLESCGFTSEIQGPLYDCYVQL
ncbi:disease resistance protein RPV1 [Lactuca sativa]|nr:disease resistance protein RPV1 [Lactuca sativa]